MKQKNPLAPAVTTPLEPSDFVNQRRKQKGPLALPNLTHLEPGDLVDEQKAAEILDSKVGTLRNWRSLGKGPRYRKIGRLVRYHRADLTAFAEAGV
jgi:hypothetical protein